MIRVLGCIIDQHNLALVALAAALCVCASAATMSMIARARAASGQGRFTWLACAGAVGGFGIWATHFVAMLAYQTHFPIAFEPLLTFFSVVLAAAMCGVGFWAAFRYGPVLGGVIVGVAISAMHYLGMMAVEAPADAVWDFRYVAASVAIAVVMMPLGLWVVLRNNSFRAYAAGAAIFTVAICGMHFTGMTAFALNPDPLAAIPKVMMAPATLTVSIGAVAFLVMGIGLFGVIFDIQQGHVRALEAANAKLNSLTDGLTIALDESQSASRAKAAFFAAMSHELRTPLNAIIGFSEMLDDNVFGPLGHPRNAEYVQDIHKSGVRLLSLINSVLDMSRMDAGKMKLMEQTVPLAGLIDGAIRTMTPQAETAGLRIGLTVPADLPEVKGDRHRLEQVLLNLLSNAIKFTPDGGRVHVSAGENEHGVWIAIADNGIGIAEGDVPMVFERFTQIDNRLARKYEGAGLGLPLAKRLIELHGGTLRLKSEPQLGTTVTITLPATRIAGRLENKGAAAA